MSAHRFASRPRPIGSSRGRSTHDPARWCGLTPWHINALANYCTRARPKACMYTLGACRRPSKSIGSVGARKRMGACCRFRYGTGTGAQGITTKLGQRLWPPTVNGAVVTRLPAESPPETPSSRLPRLPSRNSRGKPAGNSWKWLEMAGNSWKSQGAFQKEKETIARMSGNENGLVPSAAGARICPEKLAAGQPQNV